MQKSMGLNLSFGFKKQLEGDMEEKVTEVCKEWRYNLCLQVSQRCNCQRRKFRGISQYLTSSSTFFMHLFLPSVRDRIQDQTGFWSDLAQLFRCSQ